MLHPADEEDFEFVCSQIGNEKRIYNFISYFLHFILGFADPSALLKHELAYCLGQMQVGCLSFASFPNDCAVYVHCDN